MSSTSATTTDPSAEEQPLYTPKKRLIVCCDGTWMNSDTGYEKPTLFNPIGKAQTPSNVTRLSRSLRRVCRDGTLQIIAYQNGVGTGSTMADAITGGAFGRGIAENVREAYAFICANYNDGDDIILVGFSRGAFTARSVAGMIGDLGLLTRAGMDDFYPIFKDMQNWRTPGYKDPFPNVPFPNKPRGEGAEDIYRQLLLDRGLTRVNQNCGVGDLIKVKAVGVWDTVGSLGIPQISWLPKLSIGAASKEYRFYDTNLSDRIEHAFQALALDEHRPPFSPAVWERSNANKHTTELRQVWFPGNHGNVGGGWQDAGIANMSLAWMMDQLASVGVEFDEATITRIFTKLETYYRTIEAATSGSAPGPASADVELATAKAEGQSKKARKLWAVQQIYESNHPVRPWGQGALLKARSVLYTLAGFNLRTPGLYKKINVETGLPSNTFLEDTNERIHSSVRVRLATGGLGLNDSDLWQAPALKGKWRPRRTNKDYVDPIPKTRKTWEQIKEVKAHDVSADPEHHGDPARQIEIMEAAADQQRPLSGSGDGKERWVWEYCGSEKEAPAERVLVEEPLGPYERQLLRLASGKPNIYDFAEGVDVAL
ncbi:hypothetical protein BR93DRAFT_988367 [Coniochaeta sp. PMI_546]|nr:hypothetical protein BR93DRAFT_988367 [Coniochaeta sp. PMI_546]